MKLAHIERALEQPLVHPNDVLTRRNFGIAAGLLVLSLAGCRIRKEDCSHKPIPVVFERPYDPEIERQIQDDMDHLPNWMAAQVVNSGYKVLVVADEQAVRAKFGDPNSNAGAFTDQIGKNIVLDNPGNFSHEVAHAVDWSFGGLSRTPEFLNAEVPRVRNGIAQNEVLITELSGFLKAADTDTIRKLYLDIIAEYRADQDKYRRFIDVVNKPGIVRSGILLIDTDMFDIAQHVFVGGFMRHYFPEQFEPDQRAVNPEMILAFKNLEQRMSSICPSSR